MRADGTKTARRRPMFAGGRRRLRGLLHPEPSFDPAAGPFEQALFHFNESETGRTVARLIRILGTPSVSVGTAAGAPGVVRVTVAWELSWYQWGVDLGDEAPRVFEIAKGGEVHQLDPAARQWNAGVAKDGKLRLRS